MLQFHLARRAFVKKSLLFGASLPFAPALAATFAKETAAGSVRLVPLRWLTDATPDRATGVTWGVPWPKGQHSKNTSFTMRNQQNEVLSVQSWPLAFWPDGSLKWSAHVAYLNSARASGLTLSPGKAATKGKGLQVTETASLVSIDTGEMTCQLNKQGSTLISAIGRSNKLIGSAS